MLLVVLLSRPILTLVAVVVLLYHPHLGVARLRYRKRNFIKVLDFVIFTTGVGVKHTPTPLFLGGKTYVST